MKKINFIVVLSVALSLITMLWYASSVVLPVTVKSLILGSVERATRRKASLESVQINLLRGIMIKGLKIYEKDTPVLTREQVHMRLAFSLPDTVTFDLTSVDMRIQGEYHFVQKETNARVNLKNLEAQIIGRYLGQPGLVWKSGRIDIEGNVRLKGKQCVYQMQAVLSEVTLAGIPVIDTIDRISGEAGFSNTGVRSERLTGRIWGIPVEGHVEVTQEHGAFLKTDLKADLALKTLQQLLADKCKCVFPGRLRADGLLHMAITLQIPLQEAPSFMLDADITSPSISLYGLRSGALTMHYRQSGGIASIPVFNLYLYDGVIKADGQMDLHAPDLPYRVNASMDGVKIEKLKLDTQGKNKDLAGVMEGRVNWQGAYRNHSQRRGQGTIKVSDGRLWELDLFQGLGDLIFARDVSSVVFKDASCDFTIQDTQIYTNNLALKSLLFNIGGPLSLGWDGGLEGTLNIQIPDTKVPLTAPAREAMSIITGQAGRFAAIKVGGTVSSPQYRFTSVVLDLFKSLKGVIFW